MRRSEWNVSTSVVFACGGSCQCETVSGRTYLHDKLYASESLLFALKLHVGQISYKNITTTISQILFLQSSLKFTFRYKRWMHRIAYGDFHVANADALLACLRNALAYFDIQAVQIRTVISNTRCHDDFITSHVANKRFRLWNVSNILQMLSKLQNSF